MNRLEEIENYVENEFEKSGQKWFVALHIKIVENLAMKLVKIKGGNEEAIRLAVWLHDIYYSDKTEKQLNEEMISDYDNHEIVGADIAKKIMAKHNYDDEMIRLVEDIILKHRCRGVKPETLEAKILASADAMSHIENFSLLLFIGFARHGRTIKEVHDWLNKKIDRDWNDKILFPEAKEMIKEKYENVKILLNEMKRIASD